jgi:hemolysin D
MSLVSVPDRISAPAVPSNAPAPRALIDYDFPSLLAAPPKQRRILWLMAGLIASAAVALAVMQVNIVVTGNGRVISSDNDIVIQPLETSVVRTIAVKMGQHVTAGEVLATLDPTFASADQEELAAKLRTLSATYNRLEAELAGRTYDPPNPNPDEMTQRDVFRKRHAEYAAKLDAAQRKIAQYRADLATHKAEVKSLQEQIQLANNAEQIYEQLVAKDLASKLKLIETQQRLVDAKSRLETNNGDQQKLLQQIAEAQADADGFTQEWHRKLSEEMAQTRSDRDSTAARLSKADLRHKLNVLTAPQDATVLEVADRPAGSVLREAEPLIRLVPNKAPLMFEAQIDTRDVARLSIGAPVTIKLEALPWQQFGLAYGELTAITPDTLNDENSRETAEEMSAPGMKSQVRQSTIHFRGRIELRETKFRNLPDSFVLRPGMRVVADIQVGRRSLLSYVMNPITRVFNESMREP